MSNLTQQPIFSTEVNKVESADPVSATTANAAPQQLANRTLYLYEKARDTGGLGVSVEYADSLNDLTTTGTFTILEAATVKPNSAGGDCFVSSDSGEDAVLQLFFALTGEVYSRRLADSAWSAWAEFLTTASAARLNTTPTGSLLHFAGDTAPTGFIKAIGQLISRSVYSELFAVIGVTYGAGDGTTTFAVPDGRGRFLRQVDDGAGLDDGRALGSTQADSLKAHNHEYVRPDAAEVEIASGTGAFAYDEVVTNLSENTGGDETRPVNLAVNLIIRY
jgi:microcystin-dependent protein